MEIGACYTEPYLAASFNGIPFQALEAGSEHGRRGAEGEFPFGEETAYADLGRKIRRYTISARFAGTDHVAQAGALIAACEAPGPGTLVHPTRGVVQAACVTLSVRDSVLEEQGVTYVDMEFVEGGAWANGLITTTSLLGLALAPALNASSDSFTTVYAPYREPVWRQPSLLMLAQRAASLIAAEFRIAIRTTRQLSLLRAAADLEGVAEDPALMADTTVANDAIRLGSHAIAQNLDPVERYDAFKRIANWAAQQPRQDTASGDALLMHVRTVAGAYMAQSATAIAYGTMQEALAKLDATNAILAQEASLGYQRCDNNFYLVLSRFVDDFSAVMYKKAYGTPTLVEYDFGGPVSPLVAAYSIWGNAKRHRELETSNYMGAPAMLGPVVVAR